MAFEFDADIHAQFQGGSPKESPHSQAESFFFKLPAELRNRIYHLCLVRDREDEDNEDDELYADVSLVKAGVPFNLVREEDFDGPPLLSTCRQIRNEATGIHHLQHQFTVMIYNCDTSLVQKYVHDFIRPMGEAALKKWRPLFVAGKLSACCWAGLVAWCRSAWDLTFQDCELQSSSVRWADKTVILTAVNMAWMAQKQPWALVHQMLEQWREHAIEVNEIWGLD